MTAPPLRRVALHSAALLAAGSGLTRTLKARRLRRRDHRVFILEYHDVSPDGSEFEGTISQTRFRSHVHWLKKQFQIATLQEATERLTSGARLDRDLVVLTFDDGYEGNFTGAWPVLKSEAVPATIFLTTGFLGGQGLWFDIARRYLAAAQNAPNFLSEEARRLLATLFGAWPVNRDPESLVQRLKYLDPKDRSQLLDALAGSSLPLEPAAKPLSWSQVREMHQGGVEFGGHTVTHPILALESREKQQEEIQRSRDRIQEETGILPTTFAYPNGSRRDYTNETVDVLKQIGFHGACTTVRGSNQPGCDPYRLRRIGIGSDPTWVLEARLSGLFDNSARKLLSKFALRVGAG